MSTLRFSVVMLAVALPIAGQAQSTGEFDASALRARHSIELYVGFLSDVNVTSEVSVAGGTSASTTAGFIGSLAYNYWFSNEWAFAPSIGLMNADASTSVSARNVSVESAVVIPLLLGVKYMPLALTVGDVLKPYLSASVGPYWGFASDVRTATTTATESYSEVALGSRVGVGIDLALSRRFALGFTVGYHFVGDFDRRIGSAKNHSSPEFSLSFGVFVGKDNADSAIE